MLQAFNIYSNHNATRSCSCSAVAHRCQWYFWILSFRGELSCSKWLMHGRLPQDILFDAWDMRPHIDHIWICQYNALRCDAINLVNTPNVINNCVSETLVSAWVRPSALTQIVSKSQAPSFIWLRLATRPMQCSNVRSCFQDTRTQWQRFSPLFSHVLHAWSLVPVILWISAALRAAIQYRRLHNDHCDSNQCVALQPQINTQSAKMVKWHTSQLRQKLQKSSNSEKHNVEHIEINVIQSNTQRLCATADVAQFSNQEQWCRHVLHRET